MDALIGTMKAGGVAELFEAVLLDRRRAEAQATYPSTAPNRTLGGMSPRGTEAAA